jgi:hypothetical protein
MIISQSAAEIKAGHILQSKSELESICLGKCDATAMNATTSLVRPFLAKISHSSVTELDKERLVVSVTFDCQIYDSTANPVTFCHITCTFTLNYRFVDKSYEATEESLNAFKDGNAVFNCWPYVREFIQNTTARMNLDPPPLPLLRIVPKKEAVEQQLVHQ